MSEVKVGDRVLTHCYKYGVVTAIAPLDAYPMTWMVLVDGDDKAHPYLEEELMVENVEQ
jgi:hypothetical protein